MNKNFMMKIVGLSHNTVFYQIKINGTWKQFTKHIPQFIHMMYRIFPRTMKKFNMNNFTNIYDLAKWLYDYGEEYEPRETYVFHTLFD